MGDGNWRVLRVPWCIPPRSQSYQNFGFRAGQHQLLQGLLHRTCLCYVGRSRYRAENARVDNALSGRGSDIRELVGLWAKASEVEAVRMDCTNLGGHFAAFSRPSCIIVDC